MGPEPGGNAQYSPIRGQVSVGEHPPLGFGHTEASGTLQVCVVPEAPLGPFIFTLPSRDCMKGEETENKKIGCTVNLMVREPGLFLLTASWSGFCPAL